MPTAESLESIVALFENNAEYAELRAKRAKPQEARLLRREAFTWRRAANIISAKIRSP